MFFSVSVVVTVALPSSASVTSVATRAIGEDRHLRRTHARPDHVERVAAEVGAAARAQAVEQRLLGGVARPDLQVPFLDAPRERGAEGRGRHVARLDRVPHRLGDPALEGVGRVGVSGIAGIWRPITSTTLSAEISPFQPGAVTGPVASSMYDIQIGSTKKMPS